MPVLQYRPVPHDSARGYTAPSHWQSHDSHSDGPSARPRLNLQKSQQKSAHDHQHGSEFPYFPTLPELNAVNGVYCPDKEPADGKDIHRWYVPHGDVYDKP